MKVASVADLRNNFASVSRWIYEGESVTIQKRGRAFAVLSPAGKKKQSGLEWTNYEARMKRYCPEGPLGGATAAEIIVDMRGNY